MQKELLLNCHSYDQTTNQSRNNTQQQKQSLNIQNNCTDTNYEKFIQKASNKNRKKKINKKRCKQGQMQHKYNLKNKHNSPEKFRKITEETMDQNIAQKTKFSNFLQTYKRKEALLRNNIKNIIQNTQVSRIRNFKLNIQEKLKHINSQQLPKEQQDNLKQYLKTKFENLEKKLLKGLNDSRLRQKGRPRKDENYIKEAKKIIDNEFDFKLSDNLTNNLDNKVSETKQQQMQQSQKNEEDDKQTNSEEKEKPRKQITITEEEILKSNVQDIEEDDIDQKRMLRLSLFNPYIDIKCFQQIQNEF